MKNDHDLKLRQKFAVDIQRDFEESFTIWENAQRNLQRVQEVERIAGQSLAQAALLVEQERKELGSDFPCVIEDLARFEEYLAGVQEGQRLGELHAEIADSAPADPSAQ